MQRDSRSFSWCSVPGDFRAPFAPSGVTLEWDRSKVDWRDVVEVNFRLIQLFFAFMATMLRPNRNRTHWLYGSLSGRRMFSMLPLLLPKSRK